MLIPKTEITVRADVHKTITGLGTGAIKNPDEPLNTDSEWSGSYVYYGKYDGTNPTRYRVLDTQSTDFNTAEQTGEGRKTMLLDCDSLLYTARFNENASDGNKWRDDTDPESKSKIRVDLNGSEFLNKPGVFTGAEKAAIAESTKEAPITEGEKQDGSGWNVLDYAKLGGEKIFLLDAKEATRPSYGYNNTDSPGKERLHSRP